MRLLVTGVGGLLGNKIIELDKTHEVFATYHNKKPEGDFNKVKIDITNRENVEQVINEIKPDCIIHCAAMTDVDYCEDHREEAWKVNVEGTRHIVDAAKAKGIKVISISTDFVFDGKKGMYKETDKPNPISYYGETKLAAEGVVQELKNHIIVRPSVIYGVGSKKFVCWVIESLKNKQKINVAVDLFNSPTLNTDLAEALLKLSEKNATGMYHCAGSERISRYAFAKKIAKIFELDDSLIHSIISEQLNQRAKRPKDSSLDITKVQKLGIKFSDVETGLKKMKGEMK